MTVENYAAAAPAVRNAVVEPVGAQGAGLVTWARALSSAHQIATALCQTAFVPKHFAGKPDEAAAALMLGEELGFSPVTALRSIFVIGGTPGMYARALVALAQSHGHEVWTEKDTPTNVTVCGRRRGSEHVERSVWTPERARRAGYTSNKKYESDPQAMLYARAASDVCRRIAADVLAGVPHSVEELELESPAATRRVSRAKPAPEPVPEPELAPEPEPAAEAAEPAVALITRAQLTKLHACLTDLGIKDRDEGLTLISAYALREIESSKDLTKDEASRVIDRLQADVDAKNMPEPPVDAETGEVVGDDPHA